MAASIVIARGGPAHAAFPGSNGKIAFHSSRDGNVEIYSMNADGTAEARLTNETEPDFRTAWSADGARITFQSNRDGSPDIYVMNADGSGQTNVTNGSDPVFGPSWSPGGTRIAFTSVVSGEGIYVDVINVDGTGQMHLLGPGYAGVDWSPDGLQLAVASAFGPQQIFVANADGSGTPTQLTTVGSNNDPEWSPDGSKIAFTSIRDGNPEIYVMNASDGSNQTRLTTHPGQDYASAWSPDGQKIAFTSGRNDLHPINCDTNCNFEIYIMNPDGTGQTRITTNPAGDAEPDWQPLELPTPTPTRSPMATTGPPTATPRPPVGGISRDPSGTLQGASTGARESGPPLVATGTLLGSAVAVGAAGLLYARRRRA